MKSLVLGATGRTGVLFTKKALDQGHQVTALVRRAGLEEPVEWIFARDLLSRGIQGREGIGDVQVRLSPGPKGGGPGSVLNIELTSPYGQARFEAPAGEVTEFLRRAYQIVPDGQESGHIDIDAELHDLLRQAS